MEPSIRSVVGIPGLKAGEDVKYEEYVEELMRLLFQALARPGPGEDEPTSSQEEEGEVAEKKTKIF
jgi:hypothetical protein